MNGGSAGRSDNQMAGVGVVNGAEDDWFLSEIANVSMDCVAHFAGGESATGSAGAGIVNGAEDDWLSSEIANVSMDFVAHITEGQPATDSAGDIVFQDFIEVQCLFAKVVVFRIFCFQVFY